MNGEYESAEYGERIKVAARAAVEALDALAVLTAPYRGTMGAPSSPPGMDAEHFEAYHQNDIAGRATYGSTLIEALHEDLLGEESDGWDWYPAGTTEEYGT